MREGWQAISVSRRLLARWTERASTLHVLSVHARACNLVDERGDVTALATPDVGNGPFHVVVEGPAFPSSLRVGQVAQREGEHIRIGPLLIDLSSAQPWNPYLSRLNGATDGQTWNRLVKVMQEVAGLGVMPRRNTASPERYEKWTAHVQHRVEEHLARLVRGLETGNMTEVVGATRGLAGLGPGLTPAGDDILLGVMVAWQLTSRPSASSPLRLIARAAIPRTTRFSAAWLRAAAEGAFAEPWHMLARALGTGDEARIAAAVNRILQTGATSGTFAMRGFLACSERSDGSREMVYFREEKVRG